MATLQFPKNAERLSGLNRRQMLASAAAAATAVLVSHADSAAAASKLEACSEPPAGNVGAVTAWRLREIAQRNEIRREAKLPLLSIPKELRRMKHQEAMDEFGRFEAAHGKAVWAQVLKSRREAERNPNWRPGWPEGVRFQNEVYKILRAGFQQRQRIRAECRDR